MKRLKYSILLFAAIFQACSGKTIPQKKVAKILAEVYLNDTYIDQNSRLIAQADSIQLYEPIFNKYGYTTDDYVRTIDKYFSRTKKMIYFYQEAKEILEQKKEEIRLAVEDRRRGDSIYNSYTSIQNNNQRVLNYIRNKESNKWILFPYSSGNWPDENSTPAKSHISQPFARITHSFSPVIIDTTNHRLMRRDNFTNKYRNFPEWLFVADYPADTLHIGPTRNHRLLIMPVIPKCDTLSLQNDSEE